MVKKFRIQVEYEYSAAAERDQQVTAWQRHIDHVGLPIVGPGLIAGTARVQLLSVVEVID